MLTVTNLLKSRSVAYRICPRAELAVRTRVANATRARVIFLKFSTRFFLLFLSSPHSANLERVQNIPRTKSQDNHLDGIAKRISPREKKALSGRMPWIQLVDITESSPQ